MASPVTETLSAPRGRLRVTVTLDPADAPRWAVSRDEQELVLPSALGLTLSPGVSLGPGLSVVGDVRRRTHDETYPLTSGKSSEARDHFNELVVPLGATNGTRLDLVFRAYDDGVAFRYVLPAQSSVLSAPVEITAERTEFRFAADLRCWALELEGFATPYESEFHAHHVSELAPGALVGLPLTLETGNGGPALVLTEAGLTDYAGMYVGGLPGMENALVSRLAPLPDQTGDPAGVCVRASALPFASPWRVLLVADTPADLLASNLVLNLNPPCALVDVSWVRPGKVTWDWWSGPVIPDAPFPVGHNDATMRHFVDFAAEMDLEYMLVDGGWYGPSNKGTADLTRSVPGLDLPGLVGYARERGVNVLVWLHQKDAQGEGVLERAFAYYEQIGVRGVKVDFFDRDDQETVRWCQTVVETGARHRLLVDLHGVFKPTGVTRTWPNLLTHEGILGAEYNKWCARATPRHNVSIPFTRMLAGPMDYTPGAFRNVTAEQFEARGRAPMAMGTRCHQLAMYVVYESGLQMVSDYPDAIRGQVGADFLHRVPAAWDETRPLAGEIGEFVAVARRRGRDWFVGAMTGEAGRTLSLPLPFLEGAYQATIYADAPDAAERPAEVAVQTATLSATDTLSLLLAPAGGAAIYLTPVG